MNRFILTLLFLALSLSVSCGQSYALTVDEAVARAIENNHRRKQYRYLEGSAFEARGKAAADLFPSLGLSYTYTDGDENVSFIGHRYSAASVGATYNLFNGMSDVMEVREAGQSALAARYLADAVEADVVLEARTAFINVLRAGKGVDVAREGVELLERQRRDAELYYREGMTAKNDLLKVEVELSSARQTLLEAESALRLSVNGLERTVGTDIAEDEKMEDIGVLPEAPPLSREALEEEMLSRRSEVLYLDALKRSARFGMEAEKGGFLPKVDLALSYSEYGDSAYPDGVADSFDYDSRAVVSATWNLFEGFRATHGVREALYKMRAAEERLEDTRAELAFQLSGALEGFGVARGQLALAEVAVGQAEENYRVTESQFKLRAATASDLLDARVFLTRARDQHYNALYGIHQAGATLDRVLEVDRYGESYRGGKRE